MNAPTTPGIKPRPRKIALAPGFKKPPMIPPMSAAIGPRMGPKMIPKSGTVMAEAEICPAPNGVIIGKIGTTDRII
jgi:hypothetical protein